MDDLQQLIRRHKRGRSLSELVRDSANLVGKQTWHHYINGDRIAHRPPGADQIRGVARALGVDHRTVLLAAGRSIADLDIRAEDDQPRLYAALPARAELDRLTDDDIAHVAGLVRILTERRALIAAEPVPAATAEQPAPAPRPRRRRAAPQQQPAEPVLSA